MIEMKRFKGKKLIPIFVRWLKEHNYYNLYRKCVFSQVNINWRTDYGITDISFYEILDYSMNWWYSKQDVGVHGFDIETDMYDFWEDVSEKWSKFLTKNHKNIKYRKFDLKAFLGEE